MADQSSQGGVSVIVPTIGRAESLRQMLESLSTQTVKVQEVVVADGSSSNDTAVLLEQPCWQLRGLRVRRVIVQPPNAVRQRVAAIAQARGEYLLFLDDDVVLESDCVERMVKCLREDTAILGVFADLNNEPWPVPTRAWRFYLRYILRMEEGAWQGRVLGPLLRFAYNPRPKGEMPIEWLGTCNTMIRRTAYEQAGGFSDFFLHRCTMNEDVDLGLKISKLGRIVFSPTARMGHFHAPGGRVSPMIAAEDDLYNRYLVMHHTQQQSALAAFRLVVLYFVIETASNFVGCLHRLRSNGFGPRLVGRLRALFRIVAQHRPGKGIA